MMNQKDAKRMAALAYDAIEDKKGESISVIDIGTVSVLADYFIIASGGNVNQVQAIADNVQEVLYQAGYHDCKVEGYQSGQWVLLDFGCVVVHVFSREDRRFYDLERIWRDGKFLDKESLQ